MEEVNEGKERPSTAFMEKRNSDVFSVIDLGWKESSSASSNMPKKARKGKRWGISHLKKCHFAGAGQLKKGQR